MEYGIERSNDMLRDPIYLRQIKDGIQYDIGRIDKEPNGDVLYLSSSVDISLPLIIISGRLTSNAEMHNIIEKYNQGKDIGAEMAETIIRINLLDVILQTINTKIIDDSKIDIKETHIK